ncbi:hypothetical protein JCM8208_001518 [Rhodotorula glutinis]
MSPSRGAALRRRARCPPRLAVVLLVAAQARLASPAVLNSDLVDYLGGTVTGQSLSTVAYQLTVVANETAVLVSLSVDKEMGEVGWLGVGRGTAMTDADILILWPSADSTWTLSHRTASSTVMPVLVGSPSPDGPSSDSSGQVRVVPALSSADKADKPCVVTFERLLTLEDGDKYGGKEAGLEKKANQPFIYAYGDANPGEAAQDTDLKQHAMSAMGGTYVDLSAMFTADSAPIDPPLSPVEVDEGGSSGGSASSATARSTTSDPASTGGSGTASVTSGADAAGETSEAAPTGGAGEGSSGGSSSSSGASAGTSTASSTSSPSYKTLITIHGICAGAAWAFFAPLGALYARLGRGPMGRVLFPLHFKQQGFVTTPLTLTAVVLALWAVRVKGGGGLSYPHKTVGFCLVALLVAQDLLGLWAHLSRNAALRGPGGPPPPRTIQGYLHIVLGVTLVCTGFYQVHLGLERYGVSDKVLVNAFYGAAGLFTLVYGGSAAIAVVQRVRAPSPSTSHRPLRRRHHHPSSSSRRRSGPSPRPRPRPHRDTIHSRHHESSHLGTSSSSSSSTDPDEGSDTESSGWPGDSHAQQGHEQGWTSSLGTVRGAEPRAGSQGHYVDHQHQLQHLRYPNHDPEVPHAPPGPRRHPDGGGSHSSSSSGQATPYTPQPAPYASAYDAQAYGSYQLAQDPYPLPPPPTASSSFAYFAPQPRSALAAPPPQPFHDLHHRPTDSPSYAPAPSGDYAPWNGAGAQGDPPLEQHAVAGLSQLRSASDDFGQSFQHVGHAAQAYEPAGSGQWRPSAPPPPLVPFGATESWAQPQHAQPPYQSYQPQRLELQPHHYAPVPHMAPSLSPLQPPPSLYDAYSTTPGLDASSTSLWVRTQALDPSPSSVPAFAGTDEPHHSRFSTYPPSTYPPLGADLPSYATYPPPTMSHEPLAVSSNAVAGPSSASKRSRSMPGGAVGAASPPTARRSYKVSQNPDKKLTIDTPTTCTVCARPLAKLILRGKRAELDVPHAAVFTCLACSSSSSTSQSEEPPKDGKAKKATFRKRNKRFDDASAIIACDVCLRDIAVGGVLPLPLEAPDPSSRIDFMIEVVCAACDAKYKRCSDCGGGGGSRAGTGKWRCAELFPPQRKTCSLKHQRLGAFPAMEYSVYRITDIPRDEVDEISDTLKSMFVNGMLAGLCIPEVLEQDGSVYSTYEQCRQRATLGWLGFDPLLRYDIEPQTGIRRYLALRTCTPNLRKPSRQTPEDSPAVSPEPDGPAQAEQKQKHGGVVLKEGKEVAGFIIAEHELFVGNLFFCIVLPWDPTGEIFDATSLLISALIRHVDADVKQSSAERVQQGLPPLPDIVKVWTMLFFKRDSRVLTSLVKKRGFAYLEDYLAEHPEVPAEEFPPHRKCYLPVERQKEGWEILVRQQRVMADGSVDDWGARRGADEERGKKKELRARVAAAAKGSR